jgi:hypothetical protein
VNNRDYRFFLATIHLLPSMMASNSDSITSGKMRAPLSSTEIGSRLRVPILDTLIESKKHVLGRAFDGLVFVHCPLVQTFWRTLGLSMRSKTTPKIHFPVLCEQQGTPLVYASVQPLSSTIFSNTTLSPVFGCLIHILVKDLARTKDCLKTTICSKIAGLQRTVLERFHRQSSNDSIFDRNPRVVHHPSLALPQCSVDIPCSLGRN